MMHKWAQHYYFVIASQNLVSRRFVLKANHTQCKTNHTLDLGTKRLGQVVPKCIWVRFDQDVSYPNFIIYI